MKRSTKIKIYIFLVVTVVVVIGASVVFINYSSTPINPNGDKYTEVLVNIPEGSSFFKITEILDKAGLVKNRLLFYSLALTKRAFDPIQAGEYEFSVAMTPGEIIDKLMQGDNKHHYITIPKDSTVKEIAERLAEAKLIDKKTFLALAIDRDFLNTLGIKAKSIEGYLYPETYRLDITMSTRQIMKIMVDQFWNKVTPEMVKRAKKFGFDLNQFVTFASIVGQERNDSKSKREISAIFYKRLSKGMPLQSKATAVYDLEGFSGEIKQSHLKRKSPYNTYIIRGLPPGPIGNPGIDSLDATINPTRALPKKIKTLNSWSNEVLWSSFNKTERYAAFSVVINDQLPAFNFIIVGSYSGDDPQSENFIVEYIEIIDPSKQVQQRLKNFRSGNYGYIYFESSFADLVQVVDLNFDGYLDFRLLFSAGATGNNEYDSFIYDPASGKFKFHSEISELSGVTVDNDNKQIATYARTYYCLETMEYYNVIEDKLVLVKVEKTREKKMKDGTSRCYKYTEIPHNKKIKIVKKELLDGSIDKRARGPLGIPYVRPSVTEESPIKMPMSKEKNIPLQ